MENIVIIKYNPIYNQKVYNFVMEIKVNELGWKSDAVDLLDIEKIYLQGNGNFWLALNNDNVIGTIALEDMGKKRGYLQRMYLDKNYRGTGLATKLLNTLLDFSKSKSYQEIYLGTTPVAQRAIRFYEKSGFERITRLPEDFEDDTDDIFFKINI